MANNVHALPTHQALRRRRVRALPDFPRADVLTFERRLETPTLSPEQQIAELNGTITSIARSLLDAVQAIQNLDQQCRRQVPNS
jgi:hypothetical protein